MSDATARAAIYLRISLDRENNRWGVDRHREDAEALVKLRKWALVGVYEDNNVTGSGRKKRPEFERLLADVEAGLIDVIVAQEWPRLERNRADGVRIIEAAQRNHVLLTFAKGSDIDCTTAMGRLAADLFSAMARNEIEVKAERQSRGQLQRARQGRPPKGTRPLGYATNGDVIEHEAEVVRKLFTHFAVPDGVSLAALAAGLSGEAGAHIPKDLPRMPSHRRTLTIERNERRQREGLPLKAVPDNKPWASSTVLGILRNPRYAGYSVYTDRTQRESADKRRSWFAQVLRDEHGEPVRGQWDAIVPEATWLAVQQRLDEPSRITNRVGTARRHLGSGLYLCGICDVPVKAHSQRYRCAGHIVRARHQVDDWVLRVVRARLALPDLADVLVSSDEPRLRAIDAQIEVHKGRILRAERDYTDEVIEALDLKRTRDRERALIADLDAERMALRAGSDLGTMFQAKDPVAAFNEANLMRQRRVISFLFDVRLHPHPRGRKTFDPATVAITPKVNNPTA